MDRRRGSGGAVIVERVDRRVLGAVRFVDVTTGLPVDVPLDVRSSGVSIRATPRGYYVIARAPGLDAHETAFAAPPNEPAAGAVAVELTVTDRRVRRFLARRCTVRLPRATDRASSASLFRAVDVTLFPSPAARTSPGWAVVRASLVDDATGAPVAGALVLVRRASDDEPLGRGLSDERGETLVGVAGIPVTTWGDDAGPVLATRVDATLAVAADRGSPAPPDPDDLEARLDDLLVHRGDIALGSGVEQTITIRCAP
jgi:hypothetical protein